MRGIDYVGRLNSFSVLRTVYHPLEGPQSKVDRSHDVTSPDSNHHMPKPRYKLERTNIGAGSFVRLFILAYLYFVTYCATRVSSSKQQTKIQEP